MAFIQVIEMRTSKVDEIQKLEAEYRAATEGRRTVQRALVTRTATTPTATSSSCSSTPTSRRW